jgi:peptidoglycan hydrolase CwlO-like protein
MEDYQISNSTEWNNVRIKLEKSRKNLSMFKEDVDRMLYSIDTEVKKLGNLEVIARNKKSNSCIIAAQTQLDLVNQRIKNFNKFYMIALMSYT